MEGKRAAMGVIAGILAPLLLIACLLDLVLHGSYAPGTPEANFQAEYYRTLAAQAGEIGFGGAGLAEAAQAEYQRNGGTACGADYWGYFGAPPENWCCDFVYYCGDQLGLVGDGAPFGPYTAWCPSAWARMEAAGAYMFSIYDAGPMPGDVVFYYHTSGGAARNPAGSRACHIGIVINFEDGILRTVEGNAGGSDFYTSTVRKCVYTDPYGQTWQGAAVLGFARLRYPGGAVAEDLTAMVAAFEGFRQYPYWDYQQWSVGYGTRCPDGKLSDYKLHGISEEEARRLLAEHLQASQSYVTAWVSRNGLALTQAQQDALISLTYNVGPGWMSLDTYEGFRGVILEGKQGLALVQAFANICHAGGEVLPSLAERRICEAALYLTGQYVTDYTATGYTYTASGNGVIVERG